ncbi:hypothetical protein TgHK011_002045 [Trichoderma gracile]|nr:hypothetical protein TgHK011_002045 [Trichoderma gracile]
MALGDGFGQDVDVSDRVVCDAASVLLVDDMSASPAEEGLIIIRLPGREAAETPREESEAVLVEEGKEICEKSPDAATHTVQYQQWKAAKKHDDSRTQRNGYQEQQAEQRQSTRAKPLMSFQGGIVSIAGRRALLSFTNSHQFARRRLASAVSNT